MNSKDVVEVVEVLTALRSPARVDTILPFLEFKGLTLTRGQLQNTLDGLVMVGTITVNNLAEYRRVSTTVTLTRVFPKPFKLMEFSSNRKQEIPNLESKILAAIDHDGPTTIQILQRLKKELTKDYQKLTFLEVKSKLLELQKKKLVGYVMATETTPGGWITPRKVKLPCLTRN